MGSKILILSHPKLTEVVRQVVEGMEQLPEVTIRDVSFGDVFQFLNTHLHTINPHLIVTAGAHLGMLNQSDYKINVPVIPIPVTKFDLLQAVLQAQQYGKKIAIIYFKNELNTIREVVNDFDCDCQFFSYYTKEEAIERIQQLKATGIDAVIGTGLICSLADKSGIPSVFLHSEDSILKIMEYVARLETARLEIEKTALKWSEEFMKSPVFMPETNRLTENSTFRYPENQFHAGQANNALYKNVMNTLEGFLFHRPLHAFLTNSELFARKENPFQNDYLPYITAGIMKGFSTENELVALSKSFEKEGNLRIFYAFHPKESRLLLLSKAPLTNNFLTSKTKTATKSPLINLYGGFSNSSLHDEIFSAEQHFHSQIYQAQIALALAGMPVTSESILQLEETTPYYLLLTIAEQSGLPEPKMLQPLFGQQNTEKLLLTLRLLLDHGFSVTTVANHLGTSRQTVYKLMERMETLLGVLSPEKRFTLSLELRLLDMHHAMKQVEPIQARPLTVSTLG